MKILVGIMYCIENEFEQCKQAIRDQSHRDWEMFVVENLPNKEAHDTLYQTFMDRADDFDLFIKVDADMVLYRNTFFEDVIEEMKNEPNKNHFQIGVWDHFTDRLIYALHVYRSNVRWEQNDEQYFVDMVNEPTRKKTFMDFDGPLAPAADHCPNPSSFQSFHFGVHKAAKLLQVDSKNKKMDMAKGHANNVSILLRKYIDNELSHCYQFSVFGLIWGLNNQVANDEVNFDHPKTRRFFKFYEQLIQAEKKQVVQDFLKKIPLKPTSNYFNLYLINFYFLGLDKRKSFVRSIYESVSFSLKREIKKLMYGIYPFRVGEKR